MTKYIFLDTNVLLHCKDLKDLPWASVTGDSDIILLVSAPVEKEIDRLKGDSKSKRARRARKVSAIFRKALLSDDTVVIREADPRVRLTFPPPTRDPCDGYSDLDPINPDDQIVGEMLACKEYGEDRILVSHDGRPNRSAKRHGLPYFLVPEGWLLEPELDESAKALDTLKRRIARLEHLSPSITLKVESNDETVENHLSLEVTRIEEYSGERINEIVARFGAANPLWLPDEKTSFQAFQSHRDRIEKYANEDYPRYLQDIESFYRHIPQILENRTRHQELVLVLKNSGQAPANDLLLEVEVLGGLLLAAEVNVPDLKLPVAPDPPRPPRQSALANIGQMLAGMKIIKPPEPGNLLASIGPVTRDAHSFYWNKRPDGLTSTEAVLTCKDFRHTGRPDNTVLYLCVPENDQVERCTVQITVTAANLPEPIRRTISVSVVYRDVQLDEVIPVELLPSDFAA